jgi:6,7-dimethyl-8-ribityllumazine synthase
VRVALVVSSYHDFITGRLEAGARAELREGGVDDAHIVTFAVPGAFELAQAARRLAGAGEWAAVVCLGCLIKGETPHFDYIARATADGIMRAAQETGVPVTFGVLTTNTAEEAMARAGDGAGNKGREAARAALEMARLYERLGSSGAGRPSGQS